MSNEFDFGELSGDENFKAKIHDLYKNLGAASDLVNEFFSKFEYDNLSHEDKVRYNLFVAFAINTLFWIYLKIKGVDPNTHEIKQQINRVKEYMARSKEIYDKKTIMPRIDQKAAKRFVQSGLWTPSSSSSKDSEPPTAKKRKRSNSNSET